MVSPRTRPWIVCDDGIARRLRRRGLLRQGALIGRQRGHGRSDSDERRNRRPLPPSCNQCNTPYRLEEDGDVVNFFTMSFGARYDAQAVDRSQDLEGHCAKECDLSSIGRGAALSGVQSRRRWRWRVSSPSNQRPIGRC